jgi:hypothetical protein
MNSNVADINNLHVMITEIVLKSSIYYFCGYCLVMTQYSVDREMFDFHKSVHLQIYSLYTTNKMSLFSIYLFQ